MQANQIAPNADIQGLVDDGFSVVIVDNQYLVIENVPYCPSSGEVAYGDLISQFSVVNGVSQLNSDHTVWFTGSIPHTDNGKSLQDALVADTNAASVAGRQVQCRLSNKPDQPEALNQMLASYRVKMKHYVGKLSRYARNIDPLARADLRGQFRVNAAPSVFYFPNTSIARAGLDSYDEKLRQHRVAVVGVGGTGSYIVDALAKMPVSEILMFDDDEIAPHNVYRMPGAMTPGEAFAHLPKVQHLARLYGRMRSGVMGHAKKIDATNLNELDNCNFVFIAVDHGPSRGLIARYLSSKGISFIDVGIGVEKIPLKTQLHARARVTLVQPVSSELVDTLPTSDDSDEAVYDNIQLGELNAFNAMLAIVRYKQHLTFYTDEVNADTVKYKLSWGQLISERRNPE